MNLWTDSGLRWAPETESKPEIERNHLHHKDMSKSVKYNTTSQWCQHKMVSFNIWFWFGFWCSFQSRNIPENHLFYSDWTLCCMRRVWWDHWEVVLYFTDLDISLWCRWFLSISGCNSVSGADLSPESFQRFIYYIQIWHFVLRRRVCWDHWEVV